MQRLDKINEYYIFVKAGEDVCLSESENFKIIEVKGVTYADWEQYHLPKAMRQYNIDLAHFTSNTTPLSINIPYILTLHDIIFLETLPWKGTAYQKLGSVYRRYIVPSVSRKALKILTVSNFEKINIQRVLGQSDSRVQTVYNGLSPLFSEKKEKKATENTLLKYMIPDQYIFFLGNMAPKKNMFNVLKAYRNYCWRNDEPLPLVVAESNQKQIKKMLIELGSENMMGQIVLPGYISHQELSILYQNSSLFLYPSLRESFGLPILEAMASSIPVITSNVSAMPEIAGNAAHLVDPLKVEEILKGIEKILGDKVYAKNLIEKGLERSELFSWENTAIETLAVYREAEESHISKNKKVSHNPRSIIKPITFNKHDLHKRYNKNNWNRNDKKYNI